MSPFSFYIKGFHGCIIFIGTIHYIHIFTGNLFEDANTVNLINKPFILILLIVCSRFASSQSCLPEGITFYSQSEIDSFQYNYPNCTEIEGYVGIGGWYDSDIHNLDGLSVLTSIGGGLSIGNTNYGGNPQLVSIAGLSNVTSIGSGGLDICHNDSIVSLEGLENLTEINGLLMIWSNDNLVSLNGLENVNSIGQQLFITHNKCLKSMSGLDGLTSIGGFLEIILNDSLVTLTGLDNLHTVGQYVKIRDNPLLISLSGLDNLNNIGGYLGIFTNYSLGNLDGLKNLCSIGGENYNGNLAIFENNSLTSLSGLDNIESGSIIDLRIHNNYSLSECSVKSICDYLISPNGIIEIHDNSTNCNSQEEVDSACAYLSNDFQTLITEFSIYPNPAAVNFTISMPIIPNNNTVLSIFNLSGQQLTILPLTEPQTVVDMTCFPQGVYFVIVKDDKIVHVRKLIMQ